MKKFLPILIILSIIFPLVAPVATFAQGKDTCETAILHYRRQDSDYDGWGLHIWGPTAVNGVTWTAPHQPAGEDDYGIFWEVLMKDEAGFLNFIVHKGDDKDPGPDQVMTFSEVGCEIWLTQGSGEQFTGAEAAVEFMGAPPPAPVLINAPAAGENEVILHYYRSDGNYTGWGLHIWGPTAVEGITWTEPLMPAGQDDYGIYWVVEMQPEADYLNYIVHKGDEKDPGPDQKLTFSLGGREIWLIEGSAEQFTSPEEAMEAFSTLKLGDIQNKAQAFWIDKNTLAWDSVLNGNNEHYLNYSPDGSLELTENGIQGGERIPLKYRGTKLPPKYLLTMPQLIGMSILNLPDEYADLIPEILRGQIAVSAVSREGEAAGATAVQIPGILDDLYAEAAQEETLGVDFDGDVPTLKVWAPTAKSVSLLLFPKVFPAGRGEVNPEIAEAIPMTFDTATGVWSVTGETDWKNRYYLYDVEVFVRQEGAVVHNIVTDPYSFSLAMNSSFSQIVDLNDPALFPEGWDSLQKPALSAFTDIVLYELHVRDFSVIDESVPEEQRGTFLAFTNPESNGMSHLSRLAQAGVTHVHLLPVFDIATINENKAEWENVDFEALAEFPPDSEEQQAAVNPIRGLDGYNWGYDPFHYTVPEGSYSTNPEGSTRILEFRQMVQALNQTGLRVVMDVVYNHTNASGQTDKSVLDKIVPGYYHRLNNKGVVETSTCCQNTATEHAMMRKLMIDSVMTWATAYKVDGFRFDLMGHHMKADMEALRAELDALTPDSDGVNGRMVYVYGEGWNFGEVADNARGTNAIQANMAGTRIGSFNDRTRDAVRGGSPFTDQREQGYATGLYVDPNDYTAKEPEEQLAELLGLKDILRISLVGNLAEYEFTNALGETVSGSDVIYNGAPAGYTASPEENIAYVSAHDNETLFDAIQYKLPVDASLDARVQAQSFALSLVAFSQGVPFYHAGSELLRSKSMDRDSYDSTDWFNAIDWTYTDNGWGHGLPLEDKNGANWPVIQEYLGNPDIAPKQEEMLAMLALFEQWVAIRKSSPLFRLQTAEQIERLVRFHNTGPDQVPGLIVMSISDDPAKEIDPNYGAVFVVWNASPESASFTLDGIRVGNVELHPLIQDAHNAQASYAPSSQTFSLPGRSTAIFVSDAPVETLERVEEPAAMETPTEVPEVEPTATEEIAQLEPEITATPEEIARSNMPLIWPLIVGAGVLVSLTVFALLLQNRRKQD